MRNILKKYNIEIYDTGFLSDNFTNITFGLTILSWMEDFFEIKYKIKT